MLARVPRPKASRRWRSPPVEPGASARVDVGHHDICSDRHQAPDTRALCAMRSFATSQAAPGEERSVSTDEFTARPIRPDDWRALDDLFGDVATAARCRCMYWRIGAQYRHRPAEDNRRDLHSVVHRGAQLGILAFDGDTAIGWCQLTPRTDLRHLERTRRTRRVDDEPVWAITCFVVRKTYRRRGVTGTLIDAALGAARRAGAPGVEAYPLDAPTSPSATSTGYLTTFLRAGFREVERRSPEKPIVRLHFGDAGKHSPS